MLTRRAECGILGNRTLPQSDWSTPRYAFLFLHLGKAGGSTVNLAAVRNFKPNFAQLLYVRAHCFPQLHLDLLPSTFSQRGCDSFVAKPPRSVYVEFHSSSEPLFRKLRPHFSALRERYRASGGRLIVATLLREPRSLLLARYTMWGGESRDCSRGKGGLAMKQYCSRPHRTAALPLSDWLAASPGTMWDHLQRLNNASWKTSGGRCADMDRESARRLVNDRGLFDGIGTTEQMARFIEWAAAATDRRALNRSIPHVTPGNKGFYEYLLAHPEKNPHRANQTMAALFMAGLGRIVRFKDSETADARRENSTLHAALDREARCDDALHAAAKRDGLAGP